MGKNSLIKSTEKKKSEPKKMPSGTQKAAAQKNGTLSSEAASQEGATAKKSTPKTTRDTSSANSLAKPAGKELLFRKYGPLSEQISSKITPQAPKALPPAPPFIASKDPQEIQRIRALLRSRFSMDAIKAASRPLPTDTANSEASPKDGDVKKPSAADPQKTSQPLKFPSDKAPAHDNGGWEPDPVQRVIKFGIIGFVVLILLLVGASFKNSRRYYIETKTDAIEIWRGRFSPMGKERLILLHGVSAPQDSDTVYSRNHVFPLAFNYYLEKADALLDVQGIPDYEGIKEQLHKAEKFATDNDMRTNIASRLNSINLMTLLYKIDVAVSKGTIESLQQAAQLSREAGLLKLNATQSQLVAQKAVEIKNRQSALAAKAAQEGSTTGADSVP